MAEEKDLETGSEALESTDSAVEEINAPKLDVKLNKKDKEKKSSNPVAEKKAEDKSRILEYLKNEHKWENYVLLALSLFSLVLGCLIINKTLIVSEDFPLIGNFPKVFAWVLIGLSALAILLSIWPFFKPAFPELKKVTWPRGKAFLADTARVFIFLFILVGVFLLYDAFISRLLGLIIKNK